MSQERFAAAVLFLGIDGNKAWVATDQGIARVDLIQLAPSWTGDYRLLWHPPEGFVRPLALGDNSPAVAAVAELFANLDGQDQALARNQFTAALQTRVRLFQREHGLDDDGVVGLQTLLKLNEAVGVDLSAASARTMLSAGTAAGGNT